MPKQHSSVRPSRATSLRAALASLCIAVASVSGAACGGSSANLPTVATPPPEAVRSLTFLLVTPETNSAPVRATIQSIQNAFISAEYQITTDSNDPHDAAIILGVSATEKQSMMQVEVNGKRQINYLIQVHVTVKDAGKIADQRTAQLEVTGDEVPPGGGLAIVNDLTDSLRFRQWARKANEKHHPAAKPDESASPDASAAPAASSASPSDPPPSDASRDAM